MEVSVNRGINNHNSFYEGKSGSHIFIPPPTKKRPISGDDSFLLMKDKSLGGDGVNPFWAIEMEGVSNGDVSKYLNDLYGKKYKLPDGITMSVDNLIASVWDNGNQYIGTGIKRTSSPKKGMNHAKGFYSRKIIIPPFFELKIHDYEEVAKNKQAGLTGGPDGERSYKSFGNAVKKEDPKFRIKEEESGVVYSIQDSLKTALLTTLKDGDTGESSDDEFILMDTAMTTFSCGSFEEDSNNVEETAMDGSIVWSFLAQSKAKSSGSLTGSTYALIDGSRSVAGKTYIKNIKEDDGIEVIDSSSSISFKLRLANTGERGGIDNIKYFTAEKKSEDRPTNDPRIKEGTIEIPRAYNDPNSSHDTPELLVAATGVISNIMCGVKQARASIEDGVVKIPLATSSGTKEDSSTDPPAEDETLGKSGSGVVSGIKSTSSQDEYGIDSGVIRIPVASTEAEDGSTKITSGVISGVNINILPRSSYEEEYQKIEEGVIKCNLRVPEEETPEPVEIPFASAGDWDGNQDVAGITRPVGSFVSFGGAEHPPPNLSPYWDNGRLKIPLCTSEDTAGDGYDSPKVSGGIMSITEKQAGPSYGGNSNKDLTIVGGEIRIPRANTSTKNNLRSTTGLISGVNFSLTTILAGETVPPNVCEIDDGMIIIQVYIKEQSYPRSTSMYSSVPWDSN